MRWKHFYVKHKETKNVTFRKGFNRHWQSLLIDNHYIYIFYSLFFYINLISNIHLFIGFSKSKKFFIWWKRKFTYLIYLRASLPSVKNLFLISEVYLEFYWTSLFAKIPPSQMFVVVFNRPLHLLSANRSEYYFIILTQNRKNASTLLYT